MDFSKTQKNYLIDYRTYKLTKKDFLLESLKALVFICLISYAFYRSLILFFVLSPISLVYPFFSINKLSEKRRNKLLVEFKDTIYIIATFLSAGYSSENSFKNSIKEIRYLHGDNSLMVKEIINICNGLNIGKTIENGLENFSKRTGLSDIEDFCEVYNIAKKKGYNLTKVINSTCEIIREKIQITQDILASTAQKRFEQNIMSFVPFFIIIYLNLTSKGFLASLYTTLFGRFIMSICLIVYIISYKISQKILDIEI